MRVQRCWLLSMRFEPMRYIPKRAGTIWGHEEKVCQHNRRHHWEWRAPSPDGMIWVLESNSKLLGYRSQQIHWFFFFGSFVCFCLRQFEVLVFVFSFFVFVNCNQYILICYWSLGEPKFCGPTSFLNLEELFIHSVPYFPQLQNRN